MLGIDTNVLVRLLMRDDAEQFARAQELIRRESDAKRPVLISLLVMLETEWVLRSCYKLSKNDILATRSTCRGSCRYDGRSVRNRVREGPCVAR